MYGRMDGYRFTFSLPPCCVSYNEYCLENEILLWTFIRLFVQVGYDVTSENLDLPFREVDRDMSHVTVFINQWLYIHWVIGLARNPIWGPNMDIYIGSRPDTAFWPDYFFPISQTIIFSGRGVLGIGQLVTVHCYVFPNTTQYKKIITAIKI